MNNNKITILLCTILICSIFSISVTGIHVQTNLKPYWYSSVPYKVNSSDYWLPFYSFSDVPESLPLRGFTENTRNWFIDLGSFEWFSDWVQNVWGNEIPNIEENFTDFTTIEEQRESLDYLFTAMSYRLSTMGLSVNYAEKLTPPFEAWVPMVVMDDLSANGYESSNMSNWIIRPDIVETVLDESFPLINWKSDLYWFEWENHTDFSELVENKTENGTFIMVDNDFIEATDDILYEIISEKNSGSYDLIFPAILLLINEKKLYYPGFGPIGGLGHIQSQHSDIATWCINGRNNVAYFYGGDPTKPRNALTTTVLHELGHCVGLPHPHDALYDTMEGGWILDATTTSTMTYYSRSNTFDKLEKDLILNGIVLQLWRSYHDELAYFEDFSLSSSQQTTIGNLKSDLLSIHNLLKDSDVEGLNSLLTAVNNAIVTLTTDFGVSRNEISYSRMSFPLDIQVDFIVGDGFKAGEQMVNNLKDGLEDEYIYSIAPQTTLPSPMYNIRTNVTYASDEWQKNLKDFLIPLKKPANTSYYNPDLVPQGAWEVFPRQEIFQTIEGFSINGSLVETWLEDNPATPPMSDRIQYRFYLFNMGQYLSENPTATKKTSGYFYIGFLSILTIFVIRKFRNY
ncbi:MAG: hypothetical protein ACXACU_08780 [Candidatus Hodarchaeales archaeon]